MNTTATHFTLSLLLVLLSSSCTKHADLPDNDLPDGKYPMTFATAMEGLTQTRATTDNTWKGDEKIAVQVGNEVKQYIPTSGQTSKLTGADAANTFYWQKTDETKKVSAWYCGTGYEATLPTTWTVQTNQSGDGYAKSDLLYALPQDIAYSDRDKGQLTFKHLPAKVVINLTKGNGLTEENIQSATVSIFCQAITSGEINKSTGIMTQATTTGSGSTAIIPNVLTNSGFQKSVQAIVVPQQLAKGTKFIKVTIGKGTDAARDYYYTTETADDANLECGKQYTYNITVTKGKELVVTDKKTVTWQEGTATSGTVKEVKEFIVTCPQSNGVKNLKISNAALQSGDKYTVAPNTTITISYTTTYKRRRYNLVQGIAKVSTSTGADGTIIRTVSDIRGDLVFSFDEYVEVGDYYYADGTWSPDYVSGDSPACIGIVFKVGAAAGDHASDYDDKLPNGIRGYVVALTDATQDICEWGERSSDGDTPLDNVQSADNADYNGFKNTETIIKVYRNTSKWHFYDAFQAIIDYRGQVNAPQNSSGWYLPSLKQLADIYSLYQNSPSNILYDRLQSISKDNLFREAPEMTIHPNNRGRGGYWTSTEMNNADAWFIRFTDGTKEAFGKGDDWHKDSYVRAILTF